MSLVELLKNPLPPTVLLKLDKSDVFVSESPRKL